MPTTFTTSFASYGSLLTKTLSEVYDGTITVEEAREHLNDVLPAGFIITIRDVFGSTCNDGPGCSCNCEPRPGHGCKNSNHCQVHSNGCHVSC
jgi:hypothetical protein